jgi:hypothetical protein
MITLLAITLTFSGLMQPALAKKGGPSVSVPTLTVEESADLQFMREEERLARDVYRTLYAEWGVRVFNNISQSEQKHMDAILSLLNKYSIEDPAIEAALFSDPQLQELFDLLVANGTQSLLDALMVGALIEEVDIEDIAEAMERTDKTDLLAVYGSLMSGSENHLRAFVRNIETLTGETYAAQQIAQEAVDAILGR